MTPPPKPNNPADPPASPSSSSKAAGNGDAPERRDAPLPPIDTPWWRHCSMRTKVSGLVLFTGTAGVLMGMLAGLSPHPTPLGLIAVAILGGFAVVVGQAWLVSPVDRLLRWVESQGDAATPTDLDHLPTHRGDEVGRVSRALHDIAANAIRQRIQSGVLARRFDDKVRSATRNAIAKVRDEAMRDDLTGLGNRKAFNDVGQAVFDRAAQTGDELICIVLDLDHFKLVNDTHGHSAGDRVLALIGELIREDTRERDVAVRLGGDEFVVMMYGATLERATAMAERTRRRFRQRVVGVLGDESAEVNLSIGLASRQLDRSESLQRLLERADGRLYAAKRRGRGRTVVSDDPSASGSLPSLRDASPTPTTLLDEG